MKSDGYRIWFIKCLIYRGNDNTLFVNHIMFLCINITFCMYAVTFSTISFYWPFYGESYIKKEGNLDKIHYNQQLVHDSSMLIYVIYVYHIYIFKIRHQRLGLIYSDTCVPKTNCLYNSDKQTKRELRQGRDKRKKLFWI